MGPRPSYTLFEIDRGGGERPAAALTTPVNFEEPCYTVPMEQSERRFLLLVP
jgi:hypothetical protein